MGSKTRENKRARRRKRKSNLKGPNGSPCERGKKAGGSLADYAFSRDIYFRITKTPMEDTTTPEELWDEMEAIYPLVFDAPTTAIPRLEAIQETHPNLPKVLNFLSAAYSASRRPHKSSYFAHLNFKVNPDYLFARLNYGQCLLMNNKSHLIPELLENKFHIKLFQPERDVFHITEFAGFIDLVAKYFLGEGEPRIALSHIRALEEVEPDHPVARRLNELLCIIMPASMLAS